MESFESWVRHITYQFQTVSTHLYRIFLSISIACFHFFSSSSVWEKNLRKYQAKCAHTHTKRQKRVKKEIRSFRVIFGYLNLTMAFFVCSFHGTGVCEFHITGIYRAFHCHGYISSYQRSQFCDIRCPWLLEELLNSTSNRYPMQKAPSQTMLISFSMICVQPTSINYMCNISICVLISDFLSTAFPMPFLSHESKSLRLLRRLKMISLNEIMQSWCGFYFSFLLNYSVSHTKRKHMNDPNESCRHYNFIVFFSVIFYVKCLLQPFLRIHFADQK